MSSRLLFGDINTATQNMSGRAYQRKNLFGYKLFLLGKVIARKDGDLLFSDQKLLFLATELSQAAATNNPIFGNPWQTWAMSS
jgi:hypothetical protein